jgi:hypothetical protein
MGYFLVTVTEQARRDRKERRVFLPTVQFT